MFKLRKCTSTSNEFLVTCSFRSFDESFQTQGMNLREYKTAQTPIMMLRSNFVMEK